MPVSKLGGVVAVAAGGAHSCALMGEGTVRCWGDNTSGQIGNNTTSSSPVVANIPVAFKMVAVVANSVSSCALQINGFVYCWGDNSIGQLGNGNRQASAILRRV